MRESERKKPTVGIDAIRMVIYLQDCGANFMATVLLKAIERHLSQDIKEDNLFIPRSTSS